MPAPTKRSRTDLTIEEHDDPVTPTPSSSRVTPHHRRIVTTPSTPTRPILTRSATTQPPTPTHLTRSSSMLAPTRLGPGGSRGGAVVRTQSTPSIPSPTQLKAGVAPGGSGVEGKRKDPEQSIGGPKGWGKGKENIPPRKDDEREEEASRKRLRVNRTRSGSIASIRSECEYLLLADLLLTRSRSTIHRAFLVILLFPAIPPSITLAFAIVCHDPLLRLYHLR